MICAKAQSKTCLQMRRAEDEMVEWEIVNLNGRRWGRDTYPTQEAAEKELRDFWKGVSGVNLKKFSIACRH